MKTIHYRYSNLAKQVFLFLCFIYILLRGIVVMQIIFYKIPSYYDALNIPLTLLFYGIIVVALIVMFHSHTFYYITYSDHEVIYYNSLFKKKKHFEFKNASLVILDTFGIKFFSEDNDESQHKHPLFVIPFLKFGIIDAIEANDFFRMLKSQSNLKIIKKFKILPGYEKKRRIIPVIYLFLSVVVFMNFSKPLTLIILLLQNHPTGMN